MLLYPGFPLECHLPFVRHQINEKQRSLYEALEKQQHYQGSLQSISSKMEALEDQLSEPLEADKSPDSHFRAHEVNRYRKMQYLDGGKEVHLAKLSTFTSKRNRE